MKLAWESPGSPTPMLVYSCFTSSLLLLYIQSGLALHSVGSCFTSGLVLLYKQSARALQSVWSCVTVNLVLVNSHIRQKVERKGQDSGWMPHRAPTRKPEENIRLCEKEKEIQGLVHVRDSWFCVDKDVVLMHITTFLYVVHTFEKRTSRERRILS